MNNRRAVQSEYLKPTDKGVHTKSSKSVSLSTVKKRNSETQTVQTKKEYSTEAILKPVIHRRKVDETIERNVPLTNNNDSTKNANYATIERKKCHEDLNVIKSVPGRDDISGRRRGGKSVSLNLDNYNRNSMLRLEETSLPLVSPEVRNSSIANGSLTWRKPSNSKTKTFDNDRSLTLPKKFTAKGEQQENLDLKDRRHAFINVTGDFGETSDYDSLTMDAIPHMDMDILPYAALDEDDPWQFEDVDFPFEMFNTLKRDISNEQKPVELSDLTLKLVGSLNYKIGQTCPSALIACIRKSVSEYSDDADSGYHTGNNTLQSTENIPKKSPGEYTLTREQLRKNIEAFNDNNHGLIMSLQTDTNTFQGFIRVHMNLIRPINMSLPARPPSIYEALGQEDEPNATQISSFYLPKDTTKVIHIGCDTTVHEVIRTLLTKFRITDNPRKFALYEKVGSPDDKNAHMRRLSDDETPLNLCLSWKSEGLETHRFVLQENDTGEIIWDAFSIPELENFLIILNKEENEYVDQIKAKYQLMKFHMVKLLKDKTGKDYNKTAPPKAKDSDKTDQTTFAGDKREPIFV